MEKEFVPYGFVPYGLALRMKVIGFDEPCLAIYDNITDENDKDDSDRFFYIRTEGWPKELFDKVTPVPLFSQAFRWFRENHNLHAEPYTVDMGAIEYSFQIRDLYSEKYIYDNFVGAGGSYHGTFDTPEEAELKCLEKLIDIVSQQNIK